MKPEFQPLFQSWYDAASEKGMIYFDSLHTTVMKSYLLKKKTSLEAVAQTCSVKKVFL